MQMNRESVASSRSWPAWVALLLVVILVGAGLAAGCGGSEETTTTAVSVPPGWTDLSPSGPVPDPRSGASLVCDSAGGRVILFGGWDPDTDFGDTWAFDPVANTWTDLNPTGDLPAPRALYQMVYDSAASKVFLFGGTSDAGRFGDTWAYDPAAKTWSDVNVAGAPDARSAHAMVYDSDGGTVILFGGVGDAGRFDDTWAYDPNANTWTDLNPIGILPSARSGHAIVYEPLSGRVILFGGYDGSLLLNDTWAYEPAANTWTALDPAGDVPSPRGNHRMVYDSGLGRVILFGGYDGNTELGDTWAYDPVANTWSELHPTGSVPAGREEHAMVYDPTGGRVVLFGGFDATDADLNDTWSFGAAQ
jgi:N-acetylneuraminic acid mutarotase